MQELDHTIYSFNAKESKLLSKQIKTNEKLYQVQLEQDQLKRELEEAKLQLEENLWIYPQCIFYIYSPRVYLVYLIPEGLLGGNIPEGLLGGRSPLGINEMAKVASYFHYVMWFTWCVYF